MVMIADTRIMDPRTGEVIAVRGNHLDDEVLYRLELIGVQMHYQVQVDAVWREMEIGTISPVVAELRISRILSQAGFR